MSKKLKITGEELLKLDIASLRDVYREVAEVDPDAAWNEADLVTNILGLAEPADEEGKKGKSKARTFKFEKKTYKVILHAVFIPRMGTRTADEILDDKEAQEYLVKSGCVGSVIEEVN